LVLEGFSKNTHCLYFLGSSSKLDAADAVKTDRQTGRVRDFVQLRERKKKDYNFVLNKPKIKK
jgi:hypothetical protein